MALYWLALLQLSTAALPGAVVATTTAAVGPRCPVTGPRVFQSSDDGNLLLRKVEDEAVRDDILGILNAKRLEETFTACSPLFVWDDALAESAQEWADQCAMVEYQQGADLPAKLYHDQWLRRSRQVRIERLRVAVSN